MFPKYIINVQLGHLADGSNSAIPMIVGFLGFIASSTHNTQAPQSIHWKCFLCNLIALLFNGRKYEAINFIVHSTDTTII